MSTQVSGVVAPEATTPLPTPPSQLRRREGRQGIWFVMPWILGFVLWYALPMAASLWFSFTDFNLVSGEPMQFIGLENWRKLASDPLVRSSAWVTVKFAVLFLPLSVLFPLLLAYLLTAKHLWGKSFYRTMFYLPSIVPFVAAVLLFSGMFNGQTGWVNRFLGTVALPQPDWLNSTLWIYPTLALIGLWGVGNAMIIFIAGMNSVPHDLYDAARVDGASNLQTFRHVTLPILSPVTFYNVVIALIGLFQYFLVPFVLKNGSGEPAGQTLFYSLYFFRVLFRLQDMGYAAAIAWGLFFAGVVITGALFWSAKYWVHYEYTES